MYELELAAWYSEEVENHVAQCNATTPYATLQFGRRDVRHRCSRLDATRFAVDENNNTCIIGIQRLCGPGELIYRI